MDWRNWDIGRKTTYSVEDFDGRHSLTGTVTEKHEDHLIVEADGMKLWLDDWNAGMFS